MYKFDYEAYRKNAEMAKACRVPCEEMAEFYHKRGYSNIILMGVGGTTAEFTSIAQLIKNYSDVEVIVAYAPEVLVGAEYHINPDSLVLTGSKSGDTKEVVACTKYLTEKGIDVFCITGNEDTPLAKVASRSVYSSATNVENTYLQFYYFVFKLLNLRGDFPKYKEFADQMDNSLHNFLIKSREEFDGRAKEHARKYHKEPYQVWVGSGEIYGDIYLFTMCILEEMQWVKTKSVTSGEFFHGVLELYDEDTLFVLVKGLGKFRKLDDRVESFLKKINGKHEIIDLADFVSSEIDDEFMVIVSPLLTEAITTSRIAQYYEFFSGHSLDFRRYYRQFDY